MNEKKGCCEALSKRVDELERALFAIVEGLDVRLCGLEQRAADVEKAAEEFLQRQSQSTEPFVGTNMGVVISMCDGCGNGIQVTPQWEAKYGLRCTKCVEKQRQAALDAAYPVCPGCGAAYAPGDGCCFNCGDPVE